MPYWVVACRQHHQLMTGGPCKQHLLSKSQQASCRPAPADANSSTAVSNVATDLACTAKKIWKLFFFA
jgi:hypothetical protein